MATLAIVSKKLHIENKLRFCKQEIFNPTSFI